MCPWLSGSSGSPLIEVTRPLSVSIVRPQIASHRLQLRVWTAVMTHLVGRRPDAKRPAMVIPECIPPPIDIRPPAGFEQDEVVVTWRLPAAPVNLKDPRAMQFQAAVRP